MKVSAQNLCTVQSYEKLCCASADRAEPPLDLFVMSSPSRRYTAFCMRFTCCRVIAFGSLQQPLLRARFLSSCAPSIARGRGRGGENGGTRTSRVMCLMCASWRKGKQRSPRRRPVWGSIPPVCNLFAFLLQVSYRNPAMGNVTKMYFSGF